MMEFKGTKGKWEVVVKNENGILITGMNGNESICTVWGGIKEVESNAQLIASAPEMFEMLNKANDFIIKNKSQNYMVELLRREIPDIEQLLTKITTL